MTTILANNYNTYNTSYDIDNNIKIITTKNTTNATPIQNLPSGVKYGLFLFMLPFHFLVIPLQSKYIKVV